MSLAETLVAAAILTVVALSVSYFVTSSNRTSKIVEGSSACKSAVQSVIDRFSSIGTRDSVLPSVVPAGNAPSRNIALLQSPVSFLPTSIWTTPTIINQSSPPAINQSHLIVGAASTAESLLNWYRSQGICNPAIETGGIAPVANRGREIESTSLMFSALLPNVRTNMSNPRLWLNVVPYSLSTGQLRNCPAASIYSRPKSANTANDLVGGNAEMGTLAGDDDLGYRVYATLEYEENAQKKLCGTQGSYAHQIDSVNNSALIIDPPTYSDDTALNTGNGVYTACNQSGVKVRINAANAEIGSTLICQARIIEGETAEPTEKAWRACGEVAFTGQGSMSSNWDAASRSLSLTFLNLRQDRGYQLNVASVDTAGNVSQPVSLVFYVDYTRPSVTINPGARIGLPEDGQFSRGIIPAAFKAYGAPNWSAFLPNGKVQCELNPSNNAVWFSHTINDPLGTTVTECVSGGTTGLTTTSCTGNTPALSHGMHQVTMTASDVCNAGATATFDWPVVLLYSAPAPSAITTFDRDRDKPAADTDYFPVQVPSPVPAGNPVRNLFVVACDCNPLTVNGNAFRNCVTKRGDVLNSCVAPPAGQTNFEFTVFDICGRSTNPSPQKSSYAVRGDTGDVCTYIGCGVNGGLGDNDLVCYRNVSAPEELNSGFIGTCRQAIATNPSCASGDPGLYNCTACPGSGTCGARWPWVSTASPGPNCGARRFGICEPNGTEPPPPPNVCAPNYPDLGSCNASIPGSQTEYCTLQGSCYARITCPAGSYNSVSNCVANRSDPFFCNQDTTDPNCYRPVQCDTANREYRTQDQCEAQSGFDITRDMCEKLILSDGRECFKKTVHCPRGNQMPQDGGSWLFSATGYNACNAYLDPGNHNTNSNKFHRRRCLMHPNRTVNDLYSGRPICMTYFTMCDGVPIGSCESSYLANWFYSVEADLSSPSMAGCDRLCPSSTHACVVNVAANVVDCAEGTSPPPPPPPPEPIHECPTAGSCLVWGTCCGGRENEQPICQVRCVTINGYRRRVPTGNTCPANCGGIITCFTGDTRILMADGSEKPIAEIQKGDLVMSFDQKAGTYVVKPVVSTIYHAPEKRTLYKVELSSGQFLEGTYEHMVWRIPKGKRYPDWGPLGELQDGDVMFYPISPESDIAVAVLKVTTSESVTAVYNFHVKDTRTYIANGVVVHNIKPPEP